MVASENISPFSPFFLDDPEPLELKILPEQAEHFVRKQLEGPLGGLELVSLCFKALIFASNSLTTGSCLSILRLRPGSRSRIVLDPAWMETTKRREFPTSAGSKCS